LQQLPNRRRQGAKEYRQLISPWKSGRGVGSERNEAKEKTLDLENTK
jgi:hypothetical protein